MASSNNTSTTTIEKKLSQSSTGNDEVRVIGISEYEPAAQCLAEAFAVDELARYFVDTDDMSTYSEEYKWKLHLDILRYMTAAHCYKGLVTTIGPNYDAVALWMPPGKNIDDWWTILRSGMWRLLYKLSREGRARFYREFLPLLHDTKHAVMADRDDNSWYLVYIGSKPSARGKGYAKKLVEHGIALADGMGLPTYLESSALGNLGYYNRFGFVHVRDVKMVRGVRDVKLHIMVREPQKIGGGGEGSKEAREGMVEIGLR